jgi:hypothetical protein
VAVSPPLREPAARGRAAAPYEERRDMAETTLVLAMCVMLALLVIDRLTR